MHFIIEKISSKYINGFDIFVFYLCLIDNLFFPYFWILSIPISMPLVILWAAFNIKLLFRGLDGQLFFGIIFSIVLGGFVGALNYPEYIYDNIKFFFYYLYIFSSYFLFIHCIRWRQIEYNKILGLFLSFILLTALVYILNKDLYGSLVKIWNFKSGGALIEKYYFLEGYRFSFVWTDPNNISYIICALVFFIFTHENISLLKKILLAGVAGVVLVTSMSRGGFLSAGITTIIYLFFVLSKFSIRRNLFINKGSIYTILFLFISACLVVLNDFDPISKVSQNDTFIEAVDRLNERDDTRLDKWQKVYQDLSQSDFIFHIFSGYGAGTIINGEQTAPHNGHIFWIINYGFFSYLMLIVFLFRKRSAVSLYRSLWLLPVFFGFTLNVMLGEAKIFVLIMFLMALSICKSRNSLNNQ